MNNKVLNKIIKEEISEFDFLGNDAHLKEEEDNDILRNDEFQKQFIVDSLLNKDKIKTNIIDSKVDGNQNDDINNESRLTIEYKIDVKYEYDKGKEPINFELIFSCDSLTINNAPEGESWFDLFKWHDINVDLLSPAGDEIKFNSFDKAPDKIKSIFNKEYVMD